MPGSLGVPVGLFDGDGLCGDALGDGLALGDELGVVVGVAVATGVVAGDWEAVDATGVTSGVTLVDGSSALAVSASGVATETSPLTGAAVAEVADQV